MANTHPQVTAAKERARALLGNPIAYWPELAHRLGSVNAALLWSQLYYWCDRGSSPVWIYKTNDELMEETGLSRHQLQAAKTLLLDAELVAVEYRGWPRKTYYHVDIPALLRLFQVTTIAEISPTLPQDAPDAPDPIQVYPQTAPEPAGNGTPDWLACLAWLEEEIGPEPVRVWLSASEIVSAEDHQLVIGLTSAIAKDWADNRLYAPVRDALLAVTGDTWRPAFVVTRNGRSPQ